MRCFWEISIRSPLRKTSQRTHRIISKRWLFVMSLRRLTYISKKTSFLVPLWDVSKTSLASFCDFSKKKKKNTQKLFHVISVGLLQYLIKYVRFVRNTSEMKLLLGAVVGVLFTTFSDFFRLINLYIIHCH